MLGGLGTHAARGGSSPAVVDPPEGERSATKGFELGWGVYPDQEAVDGQGQDRGVLPRLPAPSAYEMYGPDQTVRAAIGRRIGITVRVVPSTFGPDDVLLS